MAWNPEALEQAWRPSRWLRGPDVAHTGSLAPEAALIGVIAGQHVVDHTALPERFHVGVHLATAAGAVAAALALGVTPAELGLQPGRLRHGLRRGLGVATVITLGVGAAALAPPTRPYFVDERVLDVTAREVATRSLVHIPLGTAVYEEVVFRGVVLGLALRRLPPAGAVAVTSALFGLWHVFPALHDQAANPASRERNTVAHVAGTVVTTGLAGVAFAWERLRTGSVLAPILTHTATNAVTYAVAAAVASRQGDDLRRSSAGP